jgi:glycosyltransferase involved in cell wall biosynthesis
MRRIVLDTRLITHTGIGTYIRTVFAGLLDVGGDYQYVAITNPALPTLPGIPAVSVRGRPLGFGAQLLPWELRGIRATLLHVPHFTAPLAWPGRLVLTIHDLIPLAIPQTIDAPFRRISAALWVQLAARRASMIIADSEFGRKDIERRLGIREDRLAVVPAAVAPEFRPPADPRAVDAFRRTLGIDRYVLCMGRDKPHKNLGRLIRALGRVPKRLRAHLVIIGLAAPTPDLAAAIASAGVRDAVRFVGHVPGHVLPLYYQAAAVVVLPSLYEGFGLPALEGMACGTPVVAADRAAIPEVVGDAALLVDPEDETAIGEGMVRVLEDSQLRERLRDRGLARARLFTPHAAASRLLSVYRRVLHEPGPHWP